MLNLPKEGAFFAENIAGHFNLSTVIEKSTFPCSKGGFNANTAVLIIFTLTFISAGEAALHKCYKAYTAQHGNT